MPMLTDKPLEYNWKTAQGIDIYAVHWPVKQPKAVIGLLHGIGEHCRRYDHLARFFQANDLALVAYDRQGYGRSGGRKGYVENFDYYLDTISRMVVECERLHPDTPVYLYGHSLGGGLLLNYLIERNPDLAGAICSAPYIRLGFPPPALKVGLGKAMRSIWPTFTQATPLEVSHLSRSPEIAPAYKADPYVHADLSAKTGIDLIEMAAKLDHFSGTIRMPVLLMHGTDDKVTAHDGSRDFVGRVDAVDKTFKSWKGLYHELHNEPEQREVMEYVLAWLNERIPKVDSRRKLKSV